MVKPKKLDADAIRYTPPTRHLRGCRHRFFSAFLLGPTMYMECPRCGLKFCLSKNMIFRLAWSHALKMLEDGKVVTSMPKKEKP